MLKKAQSAMELLVTYGWAIIVILVMIGALIYFGAFNPENFIQESCMLDNKPCESWSMIGTSPGTINIEIRNPIEYDIDVISIQVQEGKSNNVCTATIDSDQLTPGNQPQTINMGEIAIISGDFDVDCSDVINNVGNKKRFDIIVLYKASNFERYGSLELSMSGSMTVIIQE